MANENETLAAIARAMQHTREWGELHERRDQLVHVEQHLEREHMTLYRDLRELNDELEDALAWYFAVEGAHHLKPRWRQTHRSAVWKRLVEVFDRWSKARRELDL